MQLRDRGEQFPPEDGLMLAKKLKEMWCYVCPDLVKEYQKFDEDPVGKFKVRSRALLFPLSFGRLIACRRCVRVLQEYKGKNSKTGQEYKIDIGYVFMAFLWVCI